MSALELDREVRQPTRLLPRPVEMKRGINRVAVCFKLSWATDTDAQIVFTIEPKIDFLIWLQHTPEDRKLTFLQRAMQIVDHCPAEYHSVLIDGIHDFANEHDWHSSI